MSFGGDPVYRGNSSASGNVVAPVWGNVGHLFGDEHQTLYLRSPTVSLGGPNLPKPEVRWAPIYRVAASFWDAHAAPSGRRWRNLNKAAHSMNIQHSEELATC